jgi:ribonuclease J
METNYMQPEGRPTQGPHTNTEPKREGANEPGRNNRPQQSNRNRPPFGGRRKPSRGPTFRGAPDRGRKPADIIPPAGENIRIIPLGGVEEVGKNMTAIEYKDDIIVIDAGFQFREESTPGVDYILPNTKYLEERKDKIRGVVITHGHLDHIGGIPFIMDRIGNPPIYSRYLTTIMIKKRQEEFPHLPALDLRVVEQGERITMGKLKLRFFSVTHTIPDSMGIIIETPHGLIITPGDIKLDHNDGIPTEAEDKEYSQFENENVLLLLMDSTNVDNPGFSTPERLVHKNLDEIIRTIKRRLIIGTFASQMERVIAIIESAERYGKKVVVEGRSMKTNVEIATLVGRLKAKKDTIISVDEMDTLPPDKIVILATGAQGDEFAALMRMANKSHKFIKITPHDTVLLSSSVVPGNERAVQKLKDNLARQGAKIIHYRTSDVYIHSTGHGNRGEIEWLHKKIKPRFFIPIHGNHYMLRVHEEVAQTLGMPDNHIIVPDNGMVIEIQDEGKKMVKLKETAPSGIVMVDGFSIGDVQEVVMRDRKMLAEDGFLVIVASVNIKTGKLRKSPDIISRGFVYLRESQDLLQQTRILIKRSIEKSTTGMNPINFDYVKSNVSENVERFLFQKTAKRPIVIPVVLGV